VDIEAGVSSIKLEIPDGTGVKIRLDGALISKNLANSGLEKIGDYYYSENYDDAENKIDINVKMGVGNIDLRFR